MARVKRDGMVAELVAKGWAVESGAAKKRA
jgi:hypothetical protein